jgi:hypothetical protein
MVDNAKRGIAKKRSEVKQSQCRQFCQHGRTWLRVYLINTTLTSQYGGRRSSRPCLSTSMAVSQLFPTGTFGTSQLPMTDRLRR